MLTTRVVCVANFRGVNAKAPKIVPLGKNQIKKANRHTCCSWFLLYQKQFGGWAFELSKQDWQFSPFCPLKTLKCLWEISTANLEWLKLEHRSVTKMATMRALWESTPQKKHGCGHSAKQLMWQGFSRSEEWSCTILTEFLLLLLLLQFVLEQMPHSDGFFWASRKSVRIHGLRFASLNADLNALNEAAELGDVQEAERLFGVSRCKQTESHRLSISVDLHMMKLRSCFR